MYLVPLAQEICLNQESFVCASANLGDIPISPASMDGFDMLGTDQLGGLGGLNTISF
jgi:hypothetical protein